MAKFDDITGNVYGDWVVLSYAGKSRWNCRCVCGVEKSVVGATLRNGTSANCGCKKVKHGMDGTKIYRLWAHMKERCDKPTHKSYSFYGGRGISYATEWVEFKPFHEWAMANGYEEGLTLDRIDVDGNYEPSNCRFITNLEQQRNKRNNRFAIINGEKRTVSEWAEIASLNRHTILYRLNRGEEGAEILRPGRKGGGLEVYGGKSTKKRIKK